MPAAGCDWAALYHRSVLRKYSPRRKPSLFLRIRMKNVFGANLHQRCVWLGQCYLGGLGVSAMGDEGKAMHSLGLLERLGKRISGVGKVN